MNRMFGIVLYDYLQRTRSYAFLVIVAVSIYAAYLFIPGPEAHYTTLSLCNYRGVQNSAWIGYLTAMLSSLFVSLVGFYLVNSAIRKDIDTRVGLVIATTHITDFGYLISKVISNFLVLLSITGLVLVMSLAIFILRLHNQPLILASFLQPYFIITLPSIFFTACLAVTGEVLLYRFNTLVNLGYFFLFVFFLAMERKIGPAFDLFAIAPVTNTMAHLIPGYSSENTQTVSIGFIFQNTNTLRYFVFNGVYWTLNLLLGRVFYCFLGVVLVFIASRFFHRFELTILPKVNEQKRNKTLASVFVQSKFKIGQPTHIRPDYTLLPLIKAELIMLVRSGPRWLWLINLSFMLALLLAPLSIAHSYILPVFWFFQVERWADLATKQTTYKVHYFTFSSYKPLSRLLLAQLLSGILLAVSLAVPLLLRYMLLLAVQQVTSIVLGAVFIVTGAVFLGILSKGKKLFEILFFLMTYLSVTGFNYVDYYGGVIHTVFYLLLMSLLTGFLLLVAFLLRKRELSAS